MGESIQDYSWIQDFEADFPKKVSLKMLNPTDYVSFSDLVSVIEIYLTIYFGIFNILEAHSKF